MKRITYLDTYNYNGLTYEDYCEWCREEMDDEPADENSGAYWDWLAQERDVDTECFFINLKYSKENVRTCVINGKLGLWDGRHTIEPVECDTLEDAIRKCWSSCIDVEVYLEDGVVYVNAMHHDGTNCFEITPIDGKYSKYLY